MEKEITFGAFLRKQRLVAELSVRELARRIGASHSYISLIENERVPAPDEEDMMKIREILRLDKRDWVTMCELAFKTKEYTTIPVDLPVYIASNEKIRAALRVARDFGATDAEWTEFAEEIKRKHKDKAHELERK
jgi:transcriptional regulator with XRE-family HTH domain